jgi:pyridoxamine 5'-phosphate oxidase
MVLFKGVFDGGLEFFTNYNSKKSREIGKNPHAAMVFWWERQRRQIRFCGRVIKLEAKRSDEYFSARPRGSQISAWASRQSRVISSREELELRVHYYKMRFRGRKVPRPPRWGGFLLVPGSVEFWQERPNRLHDRIRYRHAAKRNWILERLSP